jgi:hypothetical protein
MPPDNAARVRQRILAIFLPVTAVLSVSCEALDPKGTDQVVTPMAGAMQAAAGIEAETGPVRPARITTGGNAAESRQPLRNRTG